MSSIRIPRMAAAFAAVSVVALAVSGCAGSDTGADPTAAPGGETRERVFAFLHSASSAGCSSIGRSVVDSRENTYSSPPWTTVSTSPFPIQKSPCWRPMCEAERQLSAERQLLLHFRRQTGSELRVAHHDDHPGVFPELVRCLVQPPIEAFSGS